LNKSRTVLHIKKSTNPKIISIENCRAIFFSLGLVLVPYNESKNTCKINISLVRICSELHPTHCSYILIL
jgi:hypothetical protein